MYCRNCGEKLNDSDIFCSKCGAKAEEIRTNKDIPQAPNPTANGNTSQAIVESKSGMGVLFALFLGIIGLIIGVLIYPYGTQARRTFVKGFWITYAVVLGIGSGVLIFVFVGAGSCLFL